MANSKGLCRTTGTFSVICDWSTFHPTKQINIILLCQTQWKEEDGFNRIHLLFSFPHCILWSSVSQTACWTLISVLPTVPLVKPALYLEPSESFPVYTKSVHSSLQLPKPGPVLNFCSIDKKEGCVQHFETHESETPSSLHRQYFFASGGEALLSQKKLNGFPKVT